MFYHQLLLHRRGQFGVIWMEAMQISPYRVTKRQALGVNVRKSCSDILDYVYARHRDQNGKRKRFSLYLSAHLMYGVVSIWQKQVQILLADTQEVKCRVKIEIAAIESINLHRILRLDQVNLPDPISRISEDNPLFGSWKDFIEPLDEFLKAEAFPEVLPSLSFDLPSIDDEKVFDPEMAVMTSSSHTVASKAEITIQELPFATSHDLDMPSPGEKDDLPGWNGQELEMIVDDPKEEVALTLQDLLPDTPGKDAQREEETPKRMTCKPEGRTKGEKKRRKRQAEDLDGTQTEQPTDSKRHAHEQDISLRLQPIEFEVSPRRKRHRRELFVDTEIKMTKDDIRHNIASSETTSKQFILPTKTISVPAKLFKSPGSRVLAQNPLLRRLWDKNLKENIHETESDKETPIWSVPDLVGGERRFHRVRHGDSSQDEGSSSKESTVGQPLDIPSDIEKTGGDTPSMEALREGSLSHSRTPHRSSLNIPSQVQSPAEDSSLSSSRLIRSQHETGDSRRSLEKSFGETSAHRDSSAHLEVLPEEVEEVQFSQQFQAIKEDIVSSPERSFIRRCQTEGAEQFTTFRKMCPISMTRIQAAKCFTTLLEQCAKGKLFLRQFKPYGDIYISTSRHKLPRSHRKVQVKHHF